MSILTYVKVLAVVALVAAVWYLGGEHARAAADDQKVALAKAAVLALEQQQSKLQAVQNDYDAIKDVPDPATMGLATRLLFRACPVHEAPAVAGGTQSASAQPASDPSLADATQRLIDACSADAKELNAVIRLAP